MHITNHRILDYTLSLLAGLIFTGLAFNAGQDLEEFALPVAKELSARPLSRTHDTACWEYSFVKLREAYPWHVSWAIEGARAGGRTATWVYDPVTRRTQMREETAAKSGLVHTMRRCTIIPFGTRNDPVLTVDALITYDVWHRLWRVRRTIGPIAIEKELQS